MNAYSAYNKENSFVKILTGCLLKVFVPAIILLFLMGCASSDQSLASKALTGSWLRADGTYTVKILEVQPEGQMEAAYFNPDPINVGRSGWLIQEEELQIYVELQDENYPGSLYQLTYDEEKKILVGTYYQALYQQTYEVYFNKVK